jgi:hypothetical protein
MTDSLKKYWSEMGKHFGYPECCINEFCEIEYKKRTKAQDMRSVHQNTGFIPCANHAELILKGEITLSSLISNRKNRAKFPSILNLEETQDAILLKMEGEGYDVTELRSNLNLRIKYNDREKETTSLDEGLCTK